MKPRHTLLPALALLALALFARADPPDLEIAAELRPSGQYVQVIPKTSAVAVLYVGLSNVDPIPSAVLKDARMFLLDTRGLPEGRYRFVAVGASKTGEQSRADFVVVVGQPGPAPPPDPGPTPPDPSPDATAFTKALREALAKEADPAKLDAAHDLAAVYRQAANVALRDTAITTLGELHDKQKAARVVMIGEAIPLVRACIQVELDNTLGTRYGEELTPDKRQKAAAKLRSVAGSLESLR